MYVIRSSSTIVSIGKKLGIGPKLSLLLSPNKKGSIRSLRLLASLIQALYTPILLPSIARPIWNHYSLQQLHVSIYSAYSILLNFLIYSQLTAKMGYSIANAGACYKKGGTNIRVAISTKVGIKASSSKDIFRLSLMPLSLYRTLSIYSRGVSKWALSY
jgi:hypothetical protein